MKHPLLTENATRCPHCSAPVVNGQRFCPRCGLQTPSPSVVLLHPEYTAPDDPDATQLAPVRLSARFYHEVTQQLARSQRLELAEQDTQTLPPLPLLEAQVTQKRFARPLPRPAAQVRAPQPQPVSHSRSTRHWRSIGVSLLLLLLFLTTSLLLPPLTNYGHSQQTQQHNLSANFQTHAQQDLENFQTAITQTTTAGLKVPATISSRFEQDQLLLASAQTPGEFLAISQDANAAQGTLQALALTSQDLANFATLLTQLQTAQLESTAFQSAYNDDQTRLQNLTQPTDFQQLQALIHAQIQQVIITSILTFPIAGNAQLEVLQADIQKLQLYGLDVHPHQARLLADQTALNQAHTLRARLLFLQQVEADISTLRDPLLQGEANYQVRQFKQMATRWGQTHPYHDQYDGKDYLLDSGYTEAGIASTLDDDLASAHTTTAYLALLAEANNAIFQLQMFEQDYQDHTAYNRPHASDLALLQRYQLQQRQVVVVSLAAQVMRVYQQGRLVRAFYVTTGRQERPSLPGIWNVQDRRSPVIFRSGDPPGSPYWFPDTPILYAILFHLGGFFIHDAPWRANFGPGTQFPHQDASGTTAYNFDGSHGCINLAENDANWLYLHTNWNLSIIIY